MQEYITSAWKKSGLGVTRCRNKIFDSDEFATGKPLCPLIIGHDRLNIFLHALLVMKAEMDKWGNQTFKADVSLVDRHFYHVFSWLFLIASSLLCL